MAKTETDLAALVAGTRAKLLAANIFVLNEEPVQHGVRLDLSNESLIVVYKTGKIVPQGRNKESTAAVLAGRAEIPKTTINTGIVNKEKPKPGVVMGDLAELPDGWTFCDTCKQLLAAVWPFCTSCGSICSQASFETFCRARGTVVDESWRYCPKCGKGAAF